MKRKSAHKKRSVLKSKKKLNSSYLYSFRYIILSSMLLGLGLLGTLLYQNLQGNNVLGTNTYLTDERSSNNPNVNASLDKNESTGQEEPYDIEPTETPEQKDIKEQEQETEKVRQEINKQIEEKNLKEMEIEPPKEGSLAGKVILQQEEGTTKEIQTPASNKIPVAQISTPQGGVVSVHVGGQNAITINNGPYAITTQYPIVINPADQTMAIRTPSGVTVIKAFPTKVFQNANSSNKLSSISSLSLEDRQGTPVYQANGVQVRKFLGLIPVTANVHEDINAQTGQVINANLPWYFSTFGFAFQTI